MQNCRDRNRSGVARRRDGGWVGDYKGAAEEILRSSCNFAVSRLWWWILASLHLSRLTELYITRVNLVYANFK